MKLLSAIREVLTPGKATFNAHLSRMESSHADLVRALHLLDQPATRDVHDATDEAAEFPLNVRNSQH